MGKLSTVDLPWSITTFVLSFSGKGGSKERDQGSNAVSETHYRSSGDPTLMEG